MLFSRSPFASSNPNPNLATAPVEAGAAPLPRNRQDTANPAAPLQPRTAPHADYDRHPLGLSAFDHYIEQPTRQQRFHVH